MTGINANDLMGVESNEPNYEEPRCTICQEEFSEIDEICGTSTYKLDECGHKFHTKCIINWFRQGNKNCPNCGDCGLSCRRGTRRGYTHNWGWTGPEIRERFTTLRAYSKRKDAPKKLKKKIEKIAKMEEDYKEYLKIDREERNKKLENITLKDAIKLRGQLRNKKYIMEKKIIDAKRRVTAWPIIPIIIPKIKYIKKTIEPSIQGPVEMEISEANVVIENQTV